MDKDVIFIIANEGYQPVEYAIPKKILEQADFIVTTASDKPTLAVASDKSTTKVDLTLNDIIIGDYAAIIFIGGPGTLDHLDNDISYALIKAANKKKLIIGAICVSPRILSNAGILKGKRVTGWDEDNKLGNIFKKAGATYVPENVIIDGHIITAIGPSAAEAFGDQLVTLLQKK